MKYRTREGDVLDAVCWQHYGRESAVVAVLEANPGLAGRGPVLPAGLVIDLPPLPEQEPGEGATRLWD